MKNSKTFVGVILLSIFAIPSFVYAAWWNPFSWYWGFSGVPASQVASSTTPESEVKTKQPVTSKKTTVKKQPVQKTKIVVPQTETIKTTTPATNVVPTTNLSSISSGYSIQNCYDICNGYSLSQPRDFCKHSKSTLSCDTYGKPSIQLDLFVNQTKAAIDLQNKNAIQTQQNTGTTQNTSSNATYETGSTAYTVQDCYNACDGYALTQPRDFCKHSQSTRSCDMYGQPSVELDLFVNQIKAAIDLQNKNALQEQQNLINQQNYVAPTCPPPPAGGGDYGVPKGCVVR